MDSTNIINKLLWQNLENAILSTWFAAFDNRLPDLHLHSTFWT